MPSPIDPARWGAIKLFATDVDGVLTDGTIHVAGNGIESKIFSVLDGLGMVKLMRAGIAVAWISGRASDATTVRAAELKITHVIQGRSDKHVALPALAAQLGLSAEQCCYVGDDDIDTGAITWAGIGCAPGDSMPSALHAADYVTARPGGRGAVREICEHILAAGGPTSR